MKQRFYTPHLLARTLGFNPQPLPRVAGLNNVGLWPVAQVNEPAPGRSTATIRFDDRGGGIGRVVVKVNGREIPVASRGAPVQPNTPIPVDLSAAELAADGNNTIEVIAYAGDNLVASRGVQVVWRRSPENASAPPVLHAIVAGVSEYESASISLRFPAKDAQDMAHALEIGGKRLFGADRIEVATFTTGSAHEPTKENLRNAFEAISAKAQPNDVVLVYSSPAMASPERLAATFITTSPAMPAPPILTTTRNYGRKPPSAAPSCSNGYAAKACRCGRWWCWTPALPRPPP